MSSGDRPFSRWEAFGVIVAGLPWRAIITTVLTTTAAVGGNQVVQDRADAPRVEQAQTVDKVAMGALAQMQEEIALLQAQVDSLKQGR